MKSLNYSKKILKNYLKFPKKSDKMPKCSNNHQVNFNWFLINFKHFKKCKLKCKLRHQVKNS